MKRPILIGCIALLLISCRKIEVYPDEPMISFREVVVRDSFDVLENPIKYVKLTFDLIDGDGDIGLTDSDTTGPFHRDSQYYYNLFITEYEKVGEEFIEVSDVDFPRNFRIPDLTPQGQNKTLKATIDIEMEYRYSETKPLPFSEFKYFFYVYDRALHPSNTDTSSLIVF